MNNIIKFERLVGVAVFITGLLVFTAYVWADTSSTSVTVGNAAPTISALALDRTTVTLLENSSVWATSTMTVIDTNGCTDITSGGGVTATFYLASTTNSGTTCGYDGNNCYTSTCTATTTGNTCTGGSDTSVEYDCGFEIWYPATATDGTAPVWSSSIWSVSATSTDGTDTGTATNTAQTVEIVTLNALSVTSSVSFGSVSANSDTGTSDQSTTITNTGNTAGDTEVSGDVMCTDYPTCSANAFVESQQKFDLVASVDYASKTYTLAATTTPATIQTILVKPTATTSAVTDIIYWGIAIPSGQAAGSYTGQNTLTAVAN